MESNQFLLFEVVRVLTAGKWIFRPLRRPIRFPAHLQRGKIANFPPLALNGRISCAVFLQPPNLRLAWDRLGPKCIGFVTDGPFNTTRKLAATRRNSAPIADCPIQLQKATIDAHDGRICWEISSWLYRKEQECFLIVLHAFDGSTAQ